MQIMRVTVQKSRFYALKELAKLVRVFRRKKETSAGRNERTSHGGSYHESLA